MARNSRPGSPAVRPRPAFPGRAGGFTYLGILLAVAFLGIALAAVGTVWATAVQRDREAELLFVGKAYRDAIRSYYLIGSGAARYPDDIQDLIEDHRFPDVRRHLRRIYADPMTGIPTGNISVPSMARSWAYAAAPTRSPSSAPTLGLTIGISQVPSVTATGSLSSWPGARPGRYASRSPAMQAFRDCDITHGCTGDAGRICKIESMLMSRMTGVAPQKTNNPCRTLRSCLRIRRGM